MLSINIIFISMCVRQKNWSLRCSIKFFYWFTSRWFACHSANHIKCFMFRTWVRILQQLTR